MMRSSQMKRDLVEMLRKVVDHFKISSQTYYHSILLFNVVRLKKGEEDDKKIFKIPVRKRKNYCPENGSEEQHNKDMSLPKIEYITVPHSEMPERDKLHLTVCFFLAHKLYEPYQLCLSSLMQYIGIQDRFSEYIKTLQIQFLYLLRFKIENMLPSNQTLFACQKWDLFMENISNSCVDVKFGIKELLESFKKQNTSQNSQKSSNITPEFKNVQNQQNFEALTRNIEIIVHNQTLYELYLKKSKNQGSSHLHPMQKIGLAILYLTILEQSSMIFTDKFDMKKKTQTSFLDFVFDDFLKSQYGITLKKLYDEISVTQSIIQETTKKQLKCYKKYKGKIYLIENLDEVKQRNLVEFLLKVKEKPIFEKFHHTFHMKSKENKSISQIRTEKQVEGLTNQPKNVKSHSIDGKNKIQESTFHHSVLSQKSDAYVQSFTSLKQRNLIAKNVFQLNKGNEKLKKKSTQSLMNSFEKKLTKTNIKKNSCTYKKTSLSSKNYLQQHQEHKVSSFAPF